MYELELVDWNEEQMVVFVNFTNPLIVSLGTLPDEIAFKFKNISIFEDGQHQYEISTASLSLNKSVPK